MKTLKKLIWYTFFSLLGFLLSFSTVKGQSSWSTATQIQPNTLTNFQYTNDSIYWIKILPDTNFCNLSFEEPQGSSNFFKRVLLYEEDGGVLNFITYRNLDSDSLSINLFNASETNYLYGKIVSNNINSSTSKLFAFTKGDSDHYPTTCDINICDNMITNGDFDVIGASPPSTASFASDYDGGWVTTINNTPLPPLAFTEGNITIFNDVPSKILNNNIWSNQITGINSATSSTPNYLICDIDYDNTSLEVVWGQIISSNIIQNCFYIFKFKSVSIYGQNHTSDNEPILYVKINGQRQNIINIPITGDYVALPSDETWKDVCVEWYSGSSQTANIEICADPIKPCTTGCTEGGDFAIDNIQFGIPKPEFHFNNVCSTSKAHFYDDTQSNNITWWHWTFGDGHVSNSPSPMHKYENHGTYNVTLTLSFQGGASCSTTKQIEIYESPPIPIIDGVNNNCDDITQHDYSVINSYFPTGTLLNWEIPMISGSFTSTGTYYASNQNINTIQTINWQPTYIPNLPNYHEIKVTAVTPDGCESIGYFKFFKCCDCENNQTSTPYSNTSITGSGNIIITDDLCINGILHISADVTFSGNDVQMGPEAKIIVDPGYTFTAKNNSIIYTGCSFMWDGIYVETPDAKVIVEDAQISGAYNAIYSKNNGDFEIKGSAGIKSSFSDNLIALKVENYDPIPQVGETTIHSGEIYNTEIITISPFTYPYFGQKSRYGIYVSNVNNLIIGDPAQNQNYFYDLKTGIRSVNSYIQVYNNKFENIKLKTLPYFERVYNNDDAAIYATNYNSSSNIPDIIIVGGSNTNEQNIFTDCNYGIFAKDLQAKIFNNDINTLANAISIYQPKSGIEVKNNTITLSPVSYSEATGIKIQNITPAYGYINVFDNTINDAKTGIWLNQCHAFKSKKVKVGFNTIVFNDNLSQNRYGIRVDGCNGIDVSHNEIEQTYNSPGGIPMHPASFNDSYKLRGISIAQSQYARVRDNRNIAGMGLGIRVAGNCRQTQFTCNYLDKNYHGFYFDTDAYISEQGTPTKKTDNKWIGNYDNSNYQYRIDGSTDHLLVPENWYYYGNTGSVYDPETQITGHPLILYVVANQTTSNLSSYCEWVINSGSIGIEEIIDSLDREEVFGEVIRSDNFYDDLQEVYDFYDNIYLFQYMLDDENFTFLGGTDDDEYQAYFDSLQNTSIGDFAEIDSLISQGNIEEAIDLNESLPENEEFYINRKQANRIFFRSFALGNYELTEADSTELMDIALQLPYPGGDGVYVARAMLGIDPDDYGVSYRKPRPDLDTSTPLSTSVKVYPNPAQNSITVEFTEDTELLNAKIEFFDIVGKNVREINLNGESNVESVSISGLKNGIYFIKISNNNTYIDTFKIIKMQ